MVIKLYIAKGENMKVGTLIKYKLNPESGAEAGAAPAAGGGGGGGGGLVPQAEAITSLDITDVFAGITPGDEYEVNELLLIGTVLFGIVFVALGGFGLASSKSSRARGKSINGSRRGKIRA